MNHSIFKTQIDIHGGGIDLKFPHHENENAQTIAHSDHGLAKYWVHSAFVDLSNVKMSKSLGNVISVKDLSKDFNLLAYRLLIIGHHYQQPINFSDSLMKQYQEDYNRIERTLKNAFIKLELSNYKYDEDNLDKELLKKFCQEMNQNLNTPNALSVVYELVKLINKESELSKLESFYNSLLMILKILGFDFEFKSLSKTDKDLYKSWEDARANKNYELADKYRLQLQEKGLI